MPTILVGFCALLGLVVGSFLNVVVWRVPRGESVLRPRSQCPSCCTQLADRDNVPVVSWLLLRGRCRTCATPISGRYPLLEIACSGLFALTAARFGFSAALPAYLVLAAALLALSIIDVEHGTVPNSIIVPTGLAVAVLLVVAALLEADPGRIAWAAAGAGGSMGMLSLVKIASPRALTAGDLRLSVVLGMAVGWLSYIVIPIFILGLMLFGMAEVITRNVATSSETSRFFRFAPAVGMGAEIAILIVARPATFLAFTS